MADEEISDCDGVKAAVQHHEADPKNDPGRERYIIKKAMELGCTEHIPDDWELT